jgi:F-type H+-transporting ATPase subunit c
MGKKSAVVILAVVALLLFAGLAFAQEGEKKLLDVNYTLFFAYSVLGAGLAIGLGALGTGVGMGSAVRGALEGAARNPDTYGRLLTTMMIGLAMIESLAIYALVIALILLYANPFKSLFGV